MGFSYFGEEGSSREFSSTSQQIWIIKLVVRFLNNVCCLAKIWRFRPSGKYFLRYGWKLVLNFFISPIAFIMLDLDFLNYLFLCRNIFCPFFVHIQFFYNRFQIQCMDLPFKKNDCIILSVCLMSSPHRTCSFIFHNTVNYLSLITTRNLLSSTCDVAKTFIACLRNYSLISFHFPYV